ncbi:hypothetical protein [Fischerella thermalis]|uniref:hypothetical protein n=1 Tax=Fischerella thermalis TaxID=372787 RepID=UPI00307DD084
MVGGWWLVVGGWWLVVVHYSTLREAAQSASTHSQSPHHPTSPSPHHPITPPP